MQNLDFLSSLHATPKSQTTNALKSQPQPPLQSEPLPKALSISQINEQAKRILEGNFSGIFIEGEVSKMSAAGSYKHWYFTLKDANSKIDCTFFNPPAHTRQPQIGEKIILAGRLSLYAKEARYQFIANRIYATSTLGSMHEIYLRLYEKLRAAGVFNRDRTLAKSFKSVGIITSASSAAMADILRVRAELGDMCTRVFIYDSLVQGASAPAKLLAALQRADAANHDVLLLARGGGSKEDLFCFNDEALAIAISRTKTPIITALGHEIDQHLADFAATLSLPTPSAAARRIFFDASERAFELDSYHKQLEQTTQRALARAREQLERKKLLLGKNPFKEYLIKLDSYKQIINKSAQNAIKTRAAQLAQAQPKERAQAAILRAKSALLERKSALKPNLLIAHINAEAARLNAAQKHAAAAINRTLCAQRTLLDAAQNRLSAHANFLNTKRKSFILHDERGTQLADVTSLQTGQIVRIASALLPQTQRHAQIID